MKLVNCHHVRKRRRRRWPSWRKPRTGPRVDEPAAAGGGDFSGNKEEELLKMMPAGRKSDQLNCDQTTALGRCNKNESGSSRSDDTSLSKGPRQGDKLIACRNTTTINQKNNTRIKLLNRLVLYSTLMCLIVCNDSANRLAKSVSDSSVAPRPAGFILAASADSDANRLYEDLMMTYNRIVTPTRNVSEKPIIRLGLKLSQLMDVNLKNQMMTINLWLNQEWSDYKLEWDPSEYGGIQEINLPAEQIWRPDIVLYNSAEGYFAVSIMTKAKVRYDGYVIWNPPAIFRSSCQIDITHFPFDIQNCHLKFGSWTFGDKLDLRHVNESEVTIERGTDLSEYYQNVEWDIMQASAKRNTIKYECCPEPYYDVTFHFKLRRKPLFYTVNLILPCVGITFFSFLVFYLPSDSGEKVTLTIGILVSLIFFLSVLIETIPSTSLAMPLLGKYLVFTMILITLSVCATVGVLNIHFRTPSTHSMPPWVKRWCMDILPKYLFMSVPQYQQNNILPEQLIYLHNQAYATQAVTLPLKQPSIITGSLPNRIVEQNQHGSSSHTTCCQSAFIDGPRQNFNTSSTKQFHANQLDATCLNEIVSSPSFPIQSTRHPQELNAALLLSSQALQTRPTTFLPYLQSEAARRLQLQRSRSSEKDNKSTSENQPTSGTSNGNEAAGTSCGDPKSDRSRDKRDVSTNSCAAIDLGASEDGKKKKSRSSSSNPIWRLFKPNKLDDPRDRDPELSTEQQQPQIQLQHRNSRSSSATSSPVARHDEDEDDDYKHHRHFQARASICSNNLWRIGPTRRCSLAVPMVNYPSYYRPLVQLQQQRGSGSGCGSMLNTISGSSCLPPIVAHRHMEGEDSEAATSSDETPNYNPGSAIRGLIDRTTTLVHPERMLDSRAGLHEMGPMTSGGFISIGSQMQPGVNAIPPRRSVTPTSFQSESQSTMPTPPPPLPPDFTESTSTNGGRNAQVHLARINYNQQQRISNPWSGSQSARMLQINSFDQDPETSSSVTTTIQHPQYVPTDLTFCHQSNQLMNERILKQHQQPQQNQSVSMSSARSMSNYRPCVNDLDPADVVTTRHSRYDNTISDHDPSRTMNPTIGGVYRSGPYLSLEQPSMSRSRSTDHRLFKLTRDPSCSNDIITNVGSGLERPNYQAYVNDQQQPNYNQMSADTTGVRRQQYHSIGRQLGQAYIQRLQRQPAIYPLQHQSRTMLPFIRDVHGLAMANLASEQSSRQQPVRYNDRGSYQLSGEPSIDMMRRSRSQTSLNRKPVAPGCLSSMDCRHCMVEGTILSSELASTANQQCTTRSLHRPQSETRGRLNSSGVRSNRVDACLRDPALSCQQSRRFDDEVNQGISHCASASMRTMPNERARNHFISNDETACRCSALGDSIVVTPNTNQPRLTNQLSPLNLLKLINEVDKAIQNAMFIAQHIDNLDEFESVKENWKYIAMVIDRIFLIVFLFICIVGTVAIFAMVPWTYYLNERPIDLDLTRLQALNLTSGDTLKHGCP